METGSEESRDGSGGKLDAVRVLHRSVVTLRAALEQSKSELTSLKEQLNNYPELSKYTAAIESLSLENHVLREKVISLSNLNKVEGKMSGNESDSDDGRNDGSDDAFHADGTQEDRADDGSRPAEDVGETPRTSKGDSEESEEVDDIELIFTTDDTKDVGLQEDLVSIAEGDRHWNGDSQVQSQSVLVETDISKCGVVAPALNRTHRHSTDESAKAKQPVVIRLSGWESRPSAGPLRSRQESEAQTDITALPPHWRSEGYLAHSKLSSALTTLPSKFAFPLPAKQSLRLSDKTQEARRVLLSDINFTSMVPELSRSADHICQDSNALMSRYPRAVCYMKDGGVCSGGGLLSPGYSSGGMCECRHGGVDCLSSSLRSRRHSTRPSLYSLDRHPSSVPSSPTHSLRSRSVSFSTCYRKSFGYECVKARTPSAYSLRQHSHMAPPLRQNSAPTSRRHVKFSDGGLGQSLPDLHSLSGSTDSLIAESEDFLRRSMDSVLSLDGGSPHPSRSTSLSSRSIAKERMGEPFLPKAPSQLRVDYWVKVITGSGRVETGRVRYVGPVPGSSEIHVGVQLGRGLGNSDGSHRGAHFFTCEQDSAVFVPFKKVILAWSG